MGTSLSKDLHGCRVHDACYDGACSERVPHIGEKLDLFFQSKESIAEALPWQHLITTVDVDLGSQYHFLYDPESLPVLSSAQARNRLPPINLNYTVLQFPKHSRVPQKLEGLSRKFIWHSQPNTHSCSLRVNLAHLGNLVSSLIVIGLINANSIDPQRPGLILQPQMLQRISQIFLHLNRSGPTNCR
jgi:hypothetical protein